LEAAAKYQLCFSFSGIIGYAPEVWEIVSSAPVDDTDDDQLFYTRIFLDENLRVCLPSVLLQSSGFIKGQEKPGISQTLFPGPEKP
jgi:hypothetical protein